MDLRWPLPHQIAIHLWGHRNLIKQLAYRDVWGRYRGSYLGIFWSFLTPLFLIVIYTFVFSQLFQVRWGGVRESTLSFPLVLFAGLIPYQLFAETVTRAPSLILSYSSYVKRVVFPLEVLPVMVVSTALVQSCSWILILLACGLLFWGPLPPTALFIPTVLFPVVLLALAFGWFLSSLGVFVRDMHHGVSLGLTALLFLSPIFYPVSALPEAFRFWIRLNPFTILVESFRQVILLGQTPDWTALGFITLVSLALAWLGLSWFMRTKPAFSDVI